MNKKVLLSVLSAGLLATTVVPVAQARELNDKEKASLKGTQAENPYRKTADGHLTSSIAPVKTNVHFARVTVVNGEGKPVAGLVLDVLVNGKAAQYTTNEGGFVEFEAAPGTRVQYRVANKPAGTYIGSTGTGFTVSADTMYTDGKIVLLGTAAAAPSEDGKKPVDNAVDQAKQQAQKDRANGTTRRALPKTHAVK